MALPAPPDGGETPTNLDGARSKHRALHLSFLPHATLHIRVTPLAKSTLVFLTSTDSATAAAASALGSFVYAMPNVCFISWMSMYGGCNAFSFSNTLYSGESMSKVLLVQLLCSRLSCIRGNFLETNYPFSASNPQALYPHLLSQSPIPSNLLRELQKCSPGAPRNPLTSDVASHGVAMASAPV
jgi:hypothetical protein